MPFLVNKVKSYLSIVLLILSLIFFGEEVKADSEKKDDPAFLSVGLGYYDFNRKKETGMEFRAEYRSDRKVLIFKPFAAISATNTSQGFVGAGILLDLFFGRRMVITPSFAPHYYWGGNTKLDLGHSIEFRSQIEFAYRFDNRSRLGMAISHYSNASLGDTNPGTETGTIYFSLPLQ
jgi:hypothetical protein